MPAEFRVGCRDRHREHEPRLCRIDHRCARVGSCGGMGGAVAAPQVRIETENKRGLSIVAPAIGKELCRNAGVAALPAKSAFRLDRDGRQPGRAHALNL
jgi:hypothetical protein